MECKNTLSDPQCGTDGKSYGNIFCLECANYGRRGGPKASKPGNPNPVSVEFISPDPSIRDKPLVRLLKPGKCPKCDCKQIWIAEKCVNPGSADKVCVALCQLEPFDYEIDCTGNKVTNGVCICPKSPNKAAIQCGADSNWYPDRCRRDCAGVPNAQKDFCNCKCGLVWNVECGFDLGFEAKFPEQCLEKCNSKRNEWDGKVFMVCYHKKMCRCELNRYDSVPHCASDHVLYPNECVVKCLGMVAISWDKCPRCNCLASLWSKECGATDYLPVIPECYKECADAKKTLAHGKREILCLSKTSKKACVCSRNFLRQCGTDGKTYKNECARKCEAEIPLAYPGHCKT